MLLNNFLNLNFQDQWQNNWSVLNWDQQFLINTGANLNYIPTNKPVSIFFVSCTILVIDIASPLLVVLTEVVGLFLRLSGAKWFIRFIDFIRSLLVRCILHLKFLDIDPYSGFSGSFGAGGQLPPIRLNKWICWKHF